MLVKPFGYVHAHQIRARIERLITNDGHILRDGHARQVRAVKERLVTYALSRLGDGYARQVGAPSNAPTPILVTVTSVEPAYTFSEITSLGSRGEIVW